MKLPAGARRIYKMNNSTDALMSVLSEVTDLLVQTRIRLDALEEVLKQTNPLVHELYLGTIENLQAQRAAELGRTLTLSLKSKLAES
jgi:hypothetical protein